MRADMSYMYKLPQPKNRENTQKVDFLTSPQALQLLMNRNSLNPKSSTDHNITDIGYAYVFRFWRKQTVTKLCEFDRKGKFNFDSARV